MAISDLGKVVNYKVIATQKASDGFVFIVEKVKSDNKFLYGRQRRLSRHSNKYYGHPIYMFHTEVINNLETVDMGIDRLEVLMSYGESEILMVTWVLKNGKKIIDYVSDNLVKVEMRLA